MATILAVFGAGVVVGTIAVIGYVVWQFRNIL